MGEIKLDVNFSISEKAYLGEALEWITLGLKPFEMPYTGIFSKKWSELSREENIQLKIAEQLFLTKLRAGEISLYKNYKDDYLSFSNEEFELKTHIYSKHQVNIASFHFEEGFIALPPRDSVSLNGCDEWVYVLTEELFRAFPRLESGSADTKSITHSGAAGRPNAKNLYMKEMRSRAEKGELSVSVRKEATYLREWLSNKNLEIAMPTVKGIENAIRDEFNKLKA